MGGAASLWKLPPPPSFLLESFLNEKPFRIECKWEGEGGGRGDLGLRNYWTHKG